MNAVPDKVFRSQCPALKPMRERAAACVRGYVAGSNAVLALVKADDLAMETVAVNMPGTGKERPNSRRKLRVPVQTLFALGSARAVLEEVRRKRETPPRTGQVKASG